MDDLKYVRKRIKNRRFGNEEEVKHPFSLFKLMYRMVMLVMCICVVVLAILLNQKLNLVKVPAVLNNFKIADIQNWLPFEGWFSLKDTAVSSTPAYILSKDDQYTNGTNSAYAMYDSVILYIQVNKEGKSSLTLRQDNGVIVTFANLSEVHVKQDERILKGKAMGSFNEYVTINCLKDNQKIDIHAAVEAK